MKFHGVTLGALACFSILLLTGCPKAEDTTKTPPGGGTTGGPPPASMNDAMNNPNVPESVKAQMRGMQKQGGGAPGGGGVR